MTKKLLLLFLISTCFTVLAKTPDFSQMTDEEKQLTGLNKLSAEELNALSQWLDNKQSKIDQERKQRNAGFEARRQARALNDRNEIKARLEKQYSDSLGNKYFELDNGQIWKSVSSGSIFLKSDGRQIVTIEPAMMGSWSIRGDSNKSLKVKRIK